jgi:purine-binding chemotaxis protein CheW
MKDILRELKDEYWRSLEVDREVKTRDLLKYVSFSLSGQTYAVPIGDVKEVTLMPGISRLPRCPEHVAGVINLRGRIIPVLDLRPLLGAPDREIRKSFRILIAQGGGLEAGFVVEAVQGIIEVERADVRLRSSGERADEDPYLAGQIETAERLTIIIDAEALICQEAPRARGEDL